MTVKSPLITMSLHMTTVNATYLTVVGRCNAVVAKWRLTPHLKST